MHVLVTIVVALHELFFFTSTVLVSRDEVVVCIKQVTYVICAATMCVSVLTFSLVGIYFIPHCCTV